MYMCVYLGRVYTCILLVLVLPSQVSCAGEYPSPWLQSLLSGEAENCRVGGGGACHKGPLETPSPRGEGSQVSWNPLSLAYH